MKVPLAGSAAPTQLAAGQGAAKSIIVDSDNVYWINGQGVVTLPL
jgi:hypothetical protein